MSRHSTVERLEERRLLAATGTLIGITGNKQTEPYLDETLYTIDYALPGTGQGSPFLDGFEDHPEAGTPADPTVIATPTLATGIGVTAGLGSLRVDVAQGQGAFWGVRTGNIVEQLKAGATSLSYDLTLLNRELNGGSYGGGDDNSFNGFAHNNKLAVVMPVAGGYIEHDFAPDVDGDTSGHNATWAGDDGTRTITWDLTRFKSGGQSLADFINSSGATDARIWLVTQGGDTNGNAGPMRFYFDNVVLKGGAGGDAVIGDFEMVAPSVLLSLPHVPDTDAIGFNPESGLLHRVSGSSSYRNQPWRIAYHDNQFMETVDVLSPGLTQTGIFNADPQGEFDGTEQDPTANPTGPYGLPAPYPTFLNLDHRRTDEETDPEFGDRGPNEYHALRDLTWSSANHLFYGTDEHGIFTLTAGGTVTFLADPFIPAGGAKGIVFFDVDGSRRLLVTERDGSNLWTIDPATGFRDESLDPVLLVDAEGNAVSGILSLVATPDGSTLLGIGKSRTIDPHDDAYAFDRELVTIDPVSGLVTPIGSLGVHMADLAFAIPTAQPVAAVQQVFVNGAGLTTGAGANGAGFRAQAGIDATYGYPVPAGANQTKSIPWTGGVNQVALRFTQQVASQLQQGDLVIRGVNTATYATSNFSYDASTRTGVWTLATPIFNDKIRLFLDDAQVSNLDGEWVNPPAGDAYPSGNGTVGGDFDFRINVLRGDATQDGTVNAQDLAFIKQRLNKTATNPGTTGAVYSVFGDLTMDGSINAQDLSAAKQRLNNKLPTADPATALLFSRRRVSA